MPKNDIKYLRNEGKPSEIILDLQEGAGWLDEAGNYVQVEIICGNRKEREGYLDEGEPMQPRGGITDKRTARAVKVKELGLTREQKAFIWQDKDGTPTRKPEIIPISETRTEKSWPHIIDWKAGGDIYETDRIYTLPVMGSKLAEKKGEIVAVKNMNDFKRFWTHFEFLVEVSEKGEVINEHEPIDNSKVEGKVPKMEEISVNDKRFNQANNPEDSAVNAKPLPEDASIKGKE